MLAVRPYCHTDHYWQVYFDTNRVIRESFGDAQFPVPEQHYIVRNAERAANGHALVPPMSMTS
jgi:small conductance mechanosensitive channel